MDPLRGLRARALSGPGAPSGQAAEPRPFRRVWPRTRATGRGARALRRRPRSSRRPGDAPVSSLARRALFSPLGGVAALATSRTRARIRARERPGGRGVSADSRTRPRWVRRRSCSSPPLAPRVAPARRHVLRGRNPACRAVFSPLAAVPAFAARPTPKNTPRA